MQRTKVVDDRQPEATQRMLVTLRFNWMPKPYRGIGSRPIFMFNMDASMLQMHQKARVSLQGFSKVDAHTGDIQTWYPGPRCFCEELVFVPGPNAATQETDGYLLGLVYDAAQHKTYLAVSFIVSFM